MNGNTIEKKLKDVKVEEMEILIYGCNYNGPINLNEIITPKYQELSVLTLDLSRIDIYVDREILEYNDKRKIDVKELRLVHFDFNRKHLELLTGFTHIGTL